MAAVPGRRRTAVDTRPEVLMTTEGTYPFAVGGVSTCSHQMITGIDDIRWTILPLIGATQPRTPRFDLPDNARLLRPLVLWEERSGAVRARRRHEGAWVPAALVRGLLRWDNDHEALLDALVWCRWNPRSVSRAFCSREAWSAWHRAVDDLRAEDHVDGGDVPDLDRQAAMRLYRTLHWVARVAATPTPPTDLLHVTAAGWAGIPAIVHRAIHGTPLVLTEHGVYLRETYLAMATARVSAADRFVNTRLARGLARASYHHADLITPVTDFNANWERALGVPAHKIHAIVNGVDPPDTAPVDPPGDQVVMSVGRIDPLKDIATMLRVASEVRRVVPGCRFVHHGPVSPGQEAYDRSCRRLHERLELGEGFVFAGPTSDPTGAVRKADVVLLTSISEGLPMAILEAMVEARPVVSTGVGGVPEVLRGVGYTAPPGDVQALASRVAFLLHNPELARVLGRGGRARVARHFSGARFIQAYRELFLDITRGERRCA